MLVLLLSDIKDLIHVDLNLFCGFGRQLIKNNILLIS